MFVTRVVPLLSFILLANSGAAAASPDPTGSCAELARTREDTAAAVARLADWMERHCPGSAEVTDPFCKLQSQTLLEQLDRLAELKASFVVNRCEVQAVGDAGRPAGSPAPLETVPLPPGTSPQAIGSFEDNWPWPGVPTFQAGLAASAAFKIRRCLDDPECEW